MSTRGLPGFLRRSRRWDDDFDNDSGDSVDSVVDDDDDVKGDNDIRNPSQQSTLKKDGRDNPVPQDDDNDYDDDDNDAEQETEARNAWSFLDPSPLAELAAREDDDAHPSMTAAASSSTNGGKVHANNNDTEEDLQRHSSIINNDGGDDSDDRSLISSLGEADLSASLTAAAASASKPSYRETQFEKILSNNVVKLSELRTIGWNGIPPQYRGRTWKILLGYLPTNSTRRQQALERKRSEYKEAIRQHYDINDNSRTLQEQETLRQVLVDVPRTAPDVPLFRNEKIKRALARLLYIWAMRHPASSYVQGINDLATPLFAVFLADYYDGEDVLDGSVMVILPEERLDEVEADVYWCLTNILAGIQDHYTADQPGVQRMVMRLEELVKRIDGELCAHIESVGIQFMQFAFKWMNCLLLREFNLRCTIRLWDTYISEDGDGFEDFHVYVCAAFLCQFSGQLQDMEFDELFQFMQAVPTEDWGETEIEMLLSQAFVLSTLFGGSDAHLLSNNGRTT